MAGFLGKRPCSRCGKRIREYHIWHNAVLCLKCLNKTTEAEQARKEGKHVA